MHEWSLENLIRTCYSLAIFFTFTGIANFIVFYLKFCLKKDKNIKIEQPFLSNEIYTFKSISSFFIGFGWLSYFLLKYNHTASVTYCMVLAVILGFICLQIAAKTVFLIKKNLYNKSSEKDISE